MGMTEAMSMMLSGWWKNFLLLGASSSRVTTSEMETVISTTVQLASTFGSTCLTSKVNQQEQNTSSTRMVGSSTNVPSSSKV